MYCVFVVLRWTWGGMWLGCGCGLLVCGVFCLLLVDVVLVLVFC